MKRRTDGRTDRRTVPLLALATLLLPTSALRAQVPATFNPRALALGGTYASTARGFEAALSNPAMLAALGRPSFTLGLGQAGVETGSNSFSFSDFRKYANRTLTDADKTYLMGRIRADDSTLTLRTIAGATPVGLSVGPFALAWYTAGGLDVSMGADAVELILYGNAHRSGNGQFFTARGSGGGGWAATVLAGSFALPIATVAGGRLAVGATYKRVLGHALGRAAEISSRFQVNPAFDVTAAGHAFYTDQGADCENRPFSLSASDDPCSMNAGSGYGVDVGAVLQRGRGFTISAVLVNALAAMNWNAGRFIYERTVDTLMEDGSGGVRDTAVSIMLRGTQIDGDPAARALRDSVLAHGAFSQVMRVGVAVRRGAWLTLTAGGSVRLRDGVDDEPSQTVSAGGEMRLLKVIPLRAGIMTDLDKTLMFSAGSGLQLLGLNLDASIASISGSRRPGVIVGVGVSFIY